MSPPPPSPETVLIPSPNGPITGYDPLTGTVLAQFNGTQCPHNGITMLGDNQFACSHVSPETGAGSIHLYYWWSLFYTQNITLPEPVAPLAATSDGSYLFSGGISGHIHSLSLPSGDIIRSFSAHEKAVSCLVISCDGSLLLSGSDDGTIVVTPILMLLDTESDLLNFKKIVGHEFPVTGLITGMGRSDGIMISSSLDWTCKVWSVVSGIHLQTVNFPGEIWSIVLDPSETELYAGGKDGKVYRKKLKVETRKQAAKGGETVEWGGVHDGGVVGVVMLKYGTILLTISENGEVYAWEVDSGRMISGFVKKIGGVSGVVVVKCDGEFGRKGVQNGVYGSQVVAGVAVKEVVEMEEGLKEVVEDRRRAISELESVIEINEKLLNLMLKEADAISKLETISS
ncbi:hypothetical protein QVD17_05484 [Tagetes erecta]|uniref:Uncharacterized protein n=1 Tax=Tagetes erecta TaxID=13708 RepID=A0AAD8LC30_TARER|nr:hypothetical protein QVD17_05484 [Tagetes erecta]